MIRGAIRRDCADGGDRSQIRLFVLTFFKSVTTHLEQDEALQQRLDRSIREFVRQFAREHRATLVSLVSDTVKRWDTETVIEKVELFVGRDLQYIRINGTLVGGVVGVCIYAVSRLL